MPRDPRTISNTTPEEILSLMEEAAKRKLQKWKKPTMCAAPECKTMFTPRRGWQAYCSEGCRRTIQRDRERKAALQPIVLLAETLREVDELKAEIARLKARINELEPQCKP